MGALKKFGIGILWAFLFPVILVGVGVVGVFGVLDFFVEFIIMIVNFFRGKKLFPLYPEDEHAMEILQRAIDRKNGELKVQEQPPAPQQVFVQQNFYAAPGAVPPPPGAALPPGYTAYPGMNPNPLPPGYNQNPNQVPPVGNPYAQPNQIPPAAQPTDNVPPRPELARLPEFDPSQYPKDKVDTIDIDIDEEGGNGE